MIEFKYAIHKPTKTIIKYEDWLKAFDENKTLSFKKILPVNFNKTIEEMTNEIYKYKPITLLTSESFEFVYNDDFTRNDYFEMINLLIGNPFFQDTELLEKIHDKIEEIDELEYKYGRIEEDE